MSQIVDATFKTQNLGGPPSRTGLVPDKKKHRKRIPILLVADVSSSTGWGPDPDIIHIGDLVNRFCGRMRQPPAGSQLSHHIDEFDISVMTYSDQPNVVIPWSLASELPASIPPFKAHGCTATGLALETALAHIGTRLKYYRHPDNNIRSGMPNLIHISDGAPTDMEIGSPRWNQIQSRISKLGGNEKKSASILHFVSPNGCVLGNPGATVKDGGQDITGQQALAKLSGPTSVFQLSSEADAFDMLVEVITRIVTLISENFDPEDAAQQAARQSNGKIKPTENYD